MMRKLVNSMHGLSPNVPMLLTALEQEVWFSDHPIEEPQRQQAQKLLEGTERLWRERVPAARRWKQRFLTCQVI